MPHDELVFCHEIGGWNTLAMTFSPNHKSSPSISSASPDLNDEVLIYKTDSAPTIEMLHSNDSTNVSDEALVTDTSDMKQVDAPSDSPSGASENPITVHANNFASKTDRKRRAPVRDFIAEKSPMPQPKTSSADAAAVSTVTVRDCVASMKEIYLLQAKEICDLKTVGEDYASDLIRDIKSNEHGSWVVLGLLAYRIQQEAFCNPGGSGKKVAFDEGRKNAMIDLAKACAAKGVKISWKTLYDFARRIRVLVEEHIAKLNLTDPSQIEEVRAARILDLVAIPSTWAKIAASSDHPDAKLAELKEKRHAASLEELLEGYRQAAKTSFERTVIEIARLRKLMPGTVLLDYKKLQGSMFTDFKTSFEDMGVKK